MKQMSLATEMQMEKVWLLNALKEAEIVKETTFDKTDGGRNINLTVEWHQEALEW